MIIPYNTPIYWFVESPNHQPTGFSSRSRIPYGVRHVSDSISEVQLLKAEIDAAGIMFHPDWSQSSLVSFKISTTSELAQSNTLHKPTERCSKTQQVRNVEFKSLGMLKISLLIIRLVILAAMLLHLLSRLISHHSLQHWWLLALLYAEALTVMVLFSSSVTSIFCHVQERSWWLKPRSENAWECVCVCVTVWMAWFNAVNLKSSFTIQK